MLDELSQSRVVGARETRRAISGGRACKVFLACDADPVLTEPIEGLARENGIPVFGEYTMAQLGAACSIAVGAAVCASLS